jgi:hypothetical protein
MLADILRKTDKRKRYLIQAVLASLVCLFAGLDIYNISKYILVPLIILFIIGGTYILHYPNIKLSNVIPSLVLPFGIVGAGILTLKTYEGLGLLLKVVLIVYVAFTYYIISLMDNIFLVVFGRDESIPLYRVATSWSQILQILVTLPVFASIFKFDLRGIEQSILIFIISFVLIMHQIWIQSFDSDTKRVGVWEMIFLSVFGSFLVAVSCLAGAFYPAEGFMRALLSASVLLFSINYVIGYLKNETSKKFILQYLFIVLIFFLLFVFFLP